MLNIDTREILLSNLNVHNDQYVKVIKIVMRFYLAKFFAKTFLQFFLVIFSIFANFCIYSDKDCKIEKEID